MYAAELYPFAVHAHGVLKTLRPAVPCTLLDVFIKSELKVGVIYVKEGQYTEEEILDNNENSPLFEEFLQVLGDKVRLKGFDRYKGGLDTVHDLTGLYSVYTNWRGIEIMFHVSTLLPYERHDPQKLQRKRHIGNDIVCVVFLEADNTSFSPACIKSHFLHTFILVRVSARIKRRPTRYEVSVVTRDEVGAYKPYLWEQSVFDKGPMFSFRPQRLNVFDPSPVFGVSPGPAFNSNSATSHSFDLDQAGGK
ncbi:Rap1 GTPase-activating protein 1 [Eumeta japonica]|uniref:Rap1 GTPase-activating protein 1 n=1 Tax=Eumeta variegata TaxID=151549 RepID=A0A4C1WBD0_EUMVA|nr:Rap1 GTPase-activating protein 1 [Eumeta japonica]